MDISLLTGQNTPNFVKDTVDRFMNMIQINEMYFTTIVTSRNMKKVIVPFNSGVRGNVLIVDDSMYEKNRSEQVEFLAKVYDHTKKQN